MNAERERVLDEQFMWIGSASKQSRSASDVTISKIFWDTAKKTKAYSFVFRNNTAERIGEYIKIAIYKNRVLIRPASVGDSIHISIKSNCNTKNSYGKIKCEPNTQELDYFIGDYELKYDPFYEIYYIEKEETNNER